MLENTALDIQHYKKDNSNSNDNSSDDDSSSNNNNSSNTSADLFKLPTILPPARPKGKLRLCEDISEEIYHQQAIGAISNFTIILRLWCEEVRISCR